MSRRIALLVNPASGKGRGARAGTRAAEQLRLAGLDVRVLVGADGAEAIALAREATGAGVDALVAVGGDGTVHQAV